MWADHKSDTGAWFVAVVERDEEGEGVEPWDDVRDTGPLVVLSESEQRDKVEQGGYAREKTSLYQANYHLVHRG